MMASFALECESPMLPGFVTRIRRWLEPLFLRVDVDRSAKELDASLDALHEKLRATGEFGAMEVDQESIPGFRLHTREVDGERYVYVEDVATKCLAGYVLFARLVELGRDADRYLRAPHSKFRPQYQRRGLATTIYRKALDAGQCLISGARQSHGAHCLWRSLGEFYNHFYVDVRDKRLTYLGDTIDSSTRAQLQTRWLMLGRNWDLVSIGQATRMQL